MVQDDTVTNQQRSAFECFPLGIGYSVLVAAAVARKPNSVAEMTAELAAEVVDMETRGSDGKES